MPRRRVYYRRELPSTVVSVVTKLCADYDRRVKVISSVETEPLVQVRCAELNQIIDSALALVDVGIRQELLNDIGRKRGYEFSVLAVCMAKNTYYNYKRRVVYEIAKGLCLI